MHSSINMQGTHRRRKETLQTDAKTKVGAWSNPTCRRRGSGFCFPAYLPVYICAYACVYRREISRSCINYAEIMLTSYQGMNGSVSFGSCQMFILTQAQIDRLTEKWTDRYHVVSYRERIYQAYIRQIQNIYRKICRCKGNLQTDYQNPHQGGKASLTPPKLGLGIFFCIFFNSDFHGFCIFLYMFCNRYDFWWLPYHILIIVRFLCFYVIFQIPTWFASQLSGVHVNLCSIQPV